MQKYTAGYLLKQQSRKLGDNYVIFTDTKVIKTRRSISHCTSINATVQIYMLNL